MTHYLPAGLGYNVPTLLLLGWVTVDILIAVAVWPLLRKRALIYRLIAWGQTQMEPTTADAELNRVRNGR